MRYDCLIIDDEEALSQSTCEYFNMFGTITAWVCDVEGCMKFFEENTADLILLDINLGGDSGFDLCKQLRRTTNIPIFFISARQSNDDMLLALSIGGDDYIQKPYSLSVLLAKVKVFLDRYRSVSVSQSVEDSDTCIRIGDLTLDTQSRSVYLNGQKIELKTMEFKLLLYLVKNKGRVIDKDELFKKVWEDSITGDNTLNVHIRRIREKLEHDPNQPARIKTVWGTGYIFEENNT